MIYKTKLLNYFRQHDRGWLLTFIAAVSILYIPFLSNPFVFDDMPFFVSGAATNYGSSWFHFDLRWFPYASLGWTAVYFSDAVPHLFHLGNAVLHIANVILLFYLLRRIICTTMPDKENDATVIWGAGLGALLFALHPVAVYAVGYVVQRSILMATFFGMLMYWSYLRGVVSGEKRWLILSIASYFLACFSKEHSALLPFALAALTMLLRHNYKLNAKTMWLTWSGYALIFVLVVLRAKGVFGTPYESMAAKLFEQEGIVESTAMLHLLSIFTQAGLFFKYLFLWLLPNPAWMSVDMREPFIDSWLSWQGLLGTSFFVLYGLFAIRWLFRGGIKGLWGFALLYPWILFLIEFSSIRVQEPFVLYRSYLWMPGLMLIVPLLLLKFPSRRSIVVISCFTLLMLPLAWNRLWVFADNYRLWNDAALLLSQEDEPGADRIFFNRGQAESKVGRWTEAEKDFQRTVTLSPQLDLLRYEWGIALLNLGRYQEALAQFDVGITLAPERGKQYLGKGLALMRLHEAIPAQLQFKKACELGENSACMLAGWMKNK
jgi:tetratricopeptide (TPR) repeat protein